MINNQGTKTQRILKEFSRYYLTLEMHRLERSDCFVGVGSRRSMHWIRRMEGSQGSPRQPQRMNGDLLSFRNPSSRIGFFHWERKHAGIFDDAFK
jgi:hypothetical protein